MDQRETIIRYRIERAYESLEEAQLLIDNQHFDAAVNRLYYACFYASVALLMCHNLAASKHSGVIALFNQHFLKTRIIDPEVGKTLNRLFDVRNRSDYEPLVRLDKDEVILFQQRARQFVDTVIDLVRQHLPQEE
ncbi:MAG: HEPN domain-containing protein [Fimbriimonadales bacterium]|nr:HEPN domain-containing protein [Fimbriimonadales bacterium]